MGKIQIFKHDPKKWKKAILENISPDNLPEYFGGDLQDPDGNPRYTTKVNTEYIISLALPTIHNLDRARRKSSEAFLPKKVRRESGKFRFKTI